MPNRNVHEVHELLKRAKQIIATRDRWTRGKLEDENGCHCALGAVYVAAGLPCLEDDRTWGKVERDYEADPATEPMAYGAIESLRAASRPTYIEDGDDLVEPVWRTNDCGGFNAVHEMFDKAIEATA